MRAVDNLSIFLLLGSAPTWQSGLDQVCAGLGSTLLLLLLLGAIGATRADRTTPKFRYKADSYYSSILATRQQYFSWKPSRQDIL